MHLPGAKNVVSSLTANGRYWDFQALERRERRGVDYTIRYRRRDAFWAVMAIHGGRIEPGTAAIADSIAGNDFSFYAFKGLKPRHNYTLHIPSHRFTSSTDGNKTPYFSRFSGTINQILKHLATAPDLC